MTDSAFLTALELVIGLDADLLDIVGLSLKISLTAVAIAALLAFPLGAALALFRFPGRAPLIVTLNALMGLSPVVAGAAMALSSVSVLLNALTLMRWRPASANLHREGELTGADA